MVARARTLRWGGGAALLAGAIGLGLVLAPVAGAQPDLPPVSAEELVASVATAEPGPFAGVVSIDNQLGLPAIPGAPAELANGTQQARIWSDGAGKGRVALPSAQSERTIVDDGTTVWTYDSASRTVTRRAATPEQRTPESAAPTDPATAANQVIATLRQTSTVNVDGTAEVAGRPAYELVLAPLPTERTLLREVRIAVDSEKRIPLRLTVLANGSAEPAFQTSFTELTFGPQDAALFTFTPPPGTTVTDAPAEQPGQGAQQAQPTVVGDGWDTVVIATRPADQQQTPQNVPDLSSVGTPVSGTWGSGRLITTAVASAILTDDGRVAAGAVPEQVLTEALAR